MSKYMLEYKVVYTNLLINPQNVAFLYAGIRWLNENIC